MKFRVLRRSLPFLLSLAALSAPGRGAPPWAVGSAPLRLHAPDPTFRAIEGKGMVASGIAGFGSSSRAGEPMLPVKILRVAIPEGTVPELHILSARRKELGSMRLAPVPRGNVERRSPQAADEKPAAQYDESPDVFGRDADFPGEAVHLGAVGYLREQRFVEVIYSPLQYNPVGRRAAFYPDVEAEVLFTQPGGSASAESFGPAPPDPYFEGTYERALVNYDQGRLFRAPGGAVSGPQSATTASMSTAAVSAAASPGPPRYKISVATEGIERLTYSDIQSAAPDLLLVDPRTWSLSVDGVEVPMSIRTVSGGPADDHTVFLQTDALEFYGRPKTEPPTTVNFMQTGFPTLYQANDFTDTQVYWLTSGGAPGSHARIPEASGSPVNGFAAATDFEQAAVWDDNTIYLPLDNVDPFFSIPSLIAGGAQAQRDLTLALPGLTSTAISPSVTLRVRGGSSLPAVPLDHDTRIWLNGDSVREFQWDGETIFQTTFSVSPSVPTNPTTIHVLVPVVSGVSVDQQFLDTITIKYRRTFDAASDALLFSYPNQNVRFAVRGLSGAPPALYEVTRSVAGTGEASPTRITGATAAGSPVTATFEVPQDTSAGAPATRTFMIVGPLGFLHPLSVQAAPAPILQDTTNAADLIVIGTPETLDASTGGALQSLLTWRLTHQGLTSKVVMMSQIYDEFSFGRRDANAIRAFLAYAFDNWKGASGVARPPSFVLLVGDATPDYKHTLLNEVWIDQVPTQMIFHSNAILGYYSSDNSLAAFRGADPLPDVHLGRISTRTAFDSAAVFAKILQYESSPPSGPWKGRAVFSASEGNDSSETADFEGLGNQVSSMYFSALPYSTSTPLLYFAEPPYNKTDLTGFKRDFANALSNGAAILTYVGHGNFDTWGNSQPLFTTQDATGLTNGGSLPFMVTVNCLTGGFHYFLASGSIGEAMTNNPNGGAIATLSPSGLSSVLAAQPFVDSLFTPMFGAPQERIIGAAADDLRAGLWGAGNLPDMQSFTLLGDPATFLATPAPAPPTGIVATAGNGTVQLTWSPPGVPPAGYRVFRSTSPAGAYAAVACSPAGATSCADTSVINATTYYYYVVSLDADGFAGRASNLNSDCDSGPDCVVARPLNPGPPSAPKGVVATDPGTGGRLVVSWLANTETDLKGYTLYYGTQSGVYPFKIALGPAATGALLSGLTNGVRYFIALSATNTSLHESAPSAEISAVPLLFDGIAPPREITDLDVARSGSDLILTWSRPLVDIYGRPTTVVKYTVYRGTAPGFLPFQIAPLATINDPSTTTYSDLGAGSPGPVNFYYLVTATDANGFTSGAGRELPNGIESLSVNRPVSGTVRLTWSAVTTDVSGADTLIDHYQVYASAFPLSRGSLGPSTLVMDNVRVLTVDLALPSGKQYYSVIAVDNRGNLSPF